MAKDDMEVIMFKILKYLYECMKLDRTPNLKEYGWESDLIGNVPQNYWCKIVHTLVEKGYVTGYDILKTKDGIQIQTRYPIEVTYEGRAFLKENSVMKQVGEHLGEAVNVAISSAMGIIIGK